MTEALSRGRASGAMDPGPRDGRHSTHARRTRRRARRRTADCVDPDPEAYRIKADEQDEAGAMMLGRLSYEAFAPVWPGMAEEFAAYNAMPKFVVSTSMQSSDLVDGWGATTILRSSADVAELKERDGGPVIIHGSATLVRALTDAGLIDRYHLLVFPVLLGAGARLFSVSDKNAQRLRLSASQAYPNGIQKLVYDAVH